MKKEEVLAIVAAHKEELKAMGVKSLELFGSVARDEASSDSDVDFLVEFEGPVSLFEVSAVHLFLEDTLGCSVDIGSRKYLKEHLRERVLKEAINAF